MRFSCDWLSRYVELPESTEELARRLTFAGLAVEYVEEVEGDTVLDVDVTTNRPDCMNHLGLAREVAVLFDRPLAPPPAEPSAGGTAPEPPVTVSIEDERCPRYAARLVRGVKVGESPEWLKRHLAAIGQRPINNVVDVTNYVLWELGQPLHAFDLSTLAGHRIVVRPGRPGEKLTTLDDVERTLDPEIMVIADAERAVALAGIMGGLETEVTEATVDVLLESAHFDPTTVRKGAGRLGLKTDASHRFERGTDPELCAFAAARAAQLIAELAGGEVLGQEIDERHHPAAGWRLEGRLEHARLERFAGVELAAGDVERWLGGLGFELAADGDGAWRVTVPSWRYFDFQPRRPDGEVWEADLYEEVVRIHGFEAIPSALPPVAGPDAPPSPGLRRRRRIRRQLAGCGYAEAITYAFQSAEEAGSFPACRQAPALELANPLSERYAVMRRGLAAGLVAAARYNLRRDVDAVRLFEVGRAFFPRPDAPLPEEVELVALVCGGDAGTPWDRGSALDFFDLKGVVEALGEEFHTRLTARAAELPGLLAGTSAELLAGETVVGFIGQAEGEDPASLFVAELVTEAMGGAGEPLAVEPPPRQPGVPVDLTFSQRLEVPWAEVATAVRELAPPDLKSFWLRDRYRGKGVPEGAVNTTISFYYNAADRSLTQEEVNQRHQALAAELQRRFGVAG